MRTWKTNRWWNGQTSVWKQGTPKNCSRTEEDHFGEPRGHQQSRTVWPKGMSWDHLAWSQHENTDELVVASAKKLNVNIKKDDTSVSHRLSKCNKDNPRPTIIARFCSRRVRDLIFNSLSKLRDHAEEIFINESLTKLNRLRFNECLKFKKANNFKFIWTKHGITFLKNTEESSIISIRNETGMVRHRIRYSVEFLKLRMIERICAKMDIILLCKICSKSCTKCYETILCKICEKWLHLKCSNLTRSQFSELTSGSIPYYCYYVFMIVCLLI